MRSLKQLGAGLSIISGCYRKTRTRDGCGDGHN